MIDNALLLMVLVPVGAAALVPVFGRFARWVVDTIAVATGLVLAALAISFVTPLHASGWLIARFMDMPQWAQVFRLDYLSALLLLVINGVGLLAIVFSIDYMRSYGGKPTYFALFLLMLAGMNGVVLSHDLFNLYVFMEVAACSSYALVAFGLKHDELEAAYKYLVLAAGASMIILLGIALVYARTGSLDMREVSAALALSPYRQGRTTLFVIMLFIAGFGLKMAMVPFHAWLPDAHPSAPAPISAMLSGVLIKASGVYALVRLLYNVFGIQDLPRIGDTLLGMGILTLVVGGLLALVQTDYKRLLAYSSIGQVGYMLLGFGLGTPLGFIAGLYHLLNHATFKSLLFLVSGSVQHRTGTRDLNRMGGLAKRMPVTALTSVFGSLAISGVPPFNGFFSKLLLVVALLSVGQQTHEARYYWYAVIAVVFSLVTLAYMLKTQRKAFFGELKSEWARTRESRPAMLVPLVVLALLTLTLGVSYPWLNQVLLGPAASVLTTTLK